METMIFFINKLLSRKKIFVYTLFLSVITFSAASAQPQFEFCNNWLQNYSFITRENRGIEQNLDDNFSWMKDQGYTHLRFFGIYPNGYHTFPSPTLDANGYPTDPALEAILEILVIKANEHGIIINFDGFEVIAESNHDPTTLGVEILTAEEVAEVVREVLSLGVTMISEEQFGGGYLQAIQTVTSQMGAIHETTGGVWWPNSAVADEQLGSVFSFYFYDQAEIESKGPYHPATLGYLHILAEGAQYHDIPFSIAVGSFGLLESENWKNVLLFSQIQHLPQRFSIEEENNDFTIGNPSFNFMDYVGDEIISFADRSFGERPIANLILDSSRLHSGPHIPSVEALKVNVPSIVNTLTLLGYKVIPTVDSIFPDAGIYYLMPAGGANPDDIFPLPDYVLSLLESDATVFIQPVFGIPDDNDAAEWNPVRQYFGLPSGDTHTLRYSIPDTVIFNGHTVKWGGADLHLIPQIEFLPVSQIDSSAASVVLSGDVSQEEVALIIQNGNKFLINSNVIHFETSYILSELLSGPLNAPAMADIAIADGKALIFAEYNTVIDIDLPWTGITHIIRYDQSGNIMLDTDIDLGSNFSELLLRGEMVFLDAD